MKRPHFLEILARFLLLLVLAVPARAEFRAGAAVVDVTPLRLPVLVNGGMLSRSLDKVKTPVNARAIALADADSRLVIVIVVVDTCMMGRALIDETKALASAKTGLPTDRILISATHTHSAPSAMGCLGTDADPAYVPFLRDKVVEAIAAAIGKLEPARIGFAKANAADFTAVRRWIRRPDRLVDDPFGNPTVRANMHAGGNWDDVVGESGPEDPDLSLIAVQTRDGRPLAVLGNFSMHYFSDNDISADYFGLFSEGLKARIAPDGDFVGAMSHGCSGDIWRRDYTRPEAWDPALTIETYTNGLLDLAMEAYAGIDYRDNVTLAMAEQRMTLAYRVPDVQLLEWSRRIVEAMGDRPPKDTMEVYAREQIFLHEARETEIVVQALRIGDIAIATTPTETYALTGLKLKAASPLPKTIVIELANGGDGYIPPPPQHAFGGYNTWPARSAGLEVMAEPKITQAALGLLEKVSNLPRRVVSLPLGPASEALRKAAPLTWWRLNEFEGPVAFDASGHHRDAHYETALAYGLEGPRSAAFCGPEATNRAVHCVGGRVHARLDDLGSEYALSLWIWNGMPDEARATSGWFYSRDHNHGVSAFGEHLGVGGNGALGFQAGLEGSATVAGTTKIPRWEWGHVVLVRAGDRVRIYLNGALEIETSAPVVTADSLFFGGRSDNRNNWEGRLDEIAVFNRALPPKEISALGTE